MSRERDISVNFAQNDLNLFLSYSLKNRLVHHNKILLKVADIQIQPHFLAPLHFAYFGLKHNVIGFLLATISSSDLWRGFVAAKKILTGLNKFLLHFFSKC